MVSLGSKRSGTPGLGTVLSAVVFFGVCVVACVAVLLKAQEQDSAFLLVIGGIGLAACGFMVTVSLMAVRNVMKARR